MKANSLRDRGPSGSRMLLLAVFFTNILLAWFLFIVMRYHNYYIENAAVPPLPFFGVKDRWMDFINLLRKAYDFSPYAVGDCGDPPFLMFCSGLLALFVKAGIKIEVVYLAFYAVCSAVCGYVYVRMGEREGGLSRLEACILAVNLLLSFPFLYAFDRGNFVVFAAALLCLFIWAYDNGHYYLAAVFLALGAAVKLHPAVLGTVFLADKRLREAAVCAVTGVAVSVVPFFLFGESLRKNVSVFMHQCLIYTTKGNGVLNGFISDKNSFYQFILIPKMLGGDPLTSLEEMTAYVTLFRICLTLLLLAAVVVCLFLPRNHDRLLILSVMSIGYPIESAPYNLILLCAPLLYWCTKESRDRIVPLLGTALLMMKSVFVISQDPYVTWQAVLNPLLELLIVAYILALRRKELVCKIKSRIKG